MNEPYPHPNQYNKPASAGLLLLGIQYRKRRLLADPGYSYCWNYSLKNISFLAQSSGSVL